MNLEERLKSLEMRFLLNNKRILKLEGHSENEIEEIYKQELTNLKSTT